MFERLREKLLPESFRESQDALVREVESLHHENEQLAESLAQLEQEDRGWDRVIAASDQEFTTIGIQNAIRATRVFYLKNPMVKRAVELQSQYVFGRGVQVTADDDATKELIQEFINANKGQLGQKALREKNTALQTDGNVYIALFTNPSDGTIKVRSIEALEIADKVMNPDDREEVWYFKRTSTRKTLDVNRGTTLTTTETIWYPALGYDPDIKPMKIGTEPIRWDVPVIHVKDGGLPHWKFGLPDPYAALTWVQEYSQFLKRWTIVQATFMRWAMKLTTPGGKKAITSAKDRLQTGIDTSTSGRDSNPPPTTGSLFVGGENTNLTAINTNNKTTEPDQARQIKLMVAAGLGWPEHMFGDPSTSNLATAKTLDRPSELRIKDRQELWQEVLQTIFDYLRDKSAKAPSGRIAEAIKAKTTKVAVKISISFPEVLEHDLSEDVAAVISAATLNGQTPAQTIPLQEVSRMLLRRLGMKEEYIAELQKKLFTADGDLIDPPEPKPTPGALEDPTAEALRSFTSLLIELREAFPREALSATEN